MRRPVFSKRNLGVLASCCALLYVGTDRARAREELRVGFTTTPAGGEREAYVHAVWVEKADGTFIKTLARWGKKRAYNLPKWDEADGSAVDGITGATPRSHATYSVTWNLRDRDGRLVPEGAYHVRFELTDDDKKEAHFNRAVWVFQKDGVAKKTVRDFEGGYMDMSFEYIITPNTVPMVKNLPVSELTGSSAVLGGCMVDAGGGDPATRIYWGDKDGGTDKHAWDHVVELGAMGEAPFSHTLRNLSREQTLFFRCHARNDVDETWAASTERFSPVDPVRVIRTGDTWSYFPGTTSPGATWVQLDFDDTAWLQGPSGFGYGDDDDATVLADMKGMYGTIYLRKHFRVADPGAVQGLLLSVDYDDGFVCFLNGEEVARRNVPSDQDHATAASRQREAGDPENLNLREAASLLRPGANVLAVEVHNAKQSSSDLSIIPELTLWGGM